MDIRNFLRSLVLPVSLYGVVGPVAGYFVWHGVNGQSGLKAGVEYEQRIGELRQELDTLQAERSQWERKIGLIRGDMVDSDILDEQARALLGRVHRNEVVILLPPSSGPAGR
ncbi:MAG: septum formation initiator family protein [Methylocystis sp.]|nr:septum formation initiator family protein [Methylocystis sp.]MBI3274803.1 septum formation initiator family protein [Methylocystis sp.]